MAPQDRVTHFLTLIRQLRAVLERETACLKAMQVGRVEELQAEKEALATAYERELRALRTAPEVMAGLEMTVRETFEHELRALQAAIKANLDALEAGRRVLEGVVRRLGEHAARVRGTAPGYAARPGSADVVAVAFRQSV